MEEKERDIYTSVVLGNSNVKFQGEREDAAFYPSLYHILVVYGVAVSEQYVVKSLCFPYFGGYLFKTLSFPIFDFFFSATSMSSCGNCLSLMSSGLFRIFAIGSSITLGYFPSRFLNFFPQVHLFFLASSF